MNKHSQYVPLDVEIARSIAAHDKGRDPGLASVSTGFVTIEEHEAQVR